MDYVNIPANAYADFLTEPDACRRIFELFADRSVYPTYLHCWGGADRTGTVAFLLGALLGMEQRDLFADYELTSFGIWGDRSVNGELFSAFLTELRQYPGNTVNECACAFLDSAGVTGAVRKQIRTILIKE